MNLTKCFVAGLCISAMTASAGMIKSNAFESVGEDSTGWSFGGSTWATTGIRVDNDTTNNRASYSNDATNRPYASADNLKVLALNTEGGVWTNTVTGGSFQYGAIYVDMLVKFVPSEELPAVDGTTKLAVAVTNGLLCVTKNDGAGANQWVGTATAIDTSLWCRVTVQLSYADPVRSASVKINGSNVTVDGNTTFTITDNDGYATLKAIGFSGTGYIDEVVVRTDDPFVTSVLLTLSFSTGIDSVYVNATPKTDGQTVTSGDSLIITASKWYEIANVAGTDVMTNWVAGAIGDSAATVTVTAAASGKTVTITPRTETSTAPQGGATLFSGQQANKVAAWAIAKGVTTLLDANYPQYLFNIATNATVPTLSIKSVAISNTTATVSVQAGTTDFSPSAINGTLKIKGYPTLGATAQVYGTGFTGTTNAIFVQDIGTNKFIKAMVQ